MNTLNRFLPSVLVVFVGQTSVHLILDQHANAGSTAKVKSRVFYGLHDSHRQIEANEMILIPENLEALLFKQAIFR